MSDKDAGLDGPGVFDLVVELVTARETMGSRQVDPTQTSPVAIVFRGKELGEWGAMLLADKRLGVLNRVLS